MGVTPRDIVDKVFTKSFRGYDEEEVDLFLDEIIKELEAKNNEIRAQYGRVNELMARLSAAQQVAMPSNLLATQRSAEEFLTSANMKARTIVQQAQQHAVNLRSRAEEMAGAKLREADDAAKEIVHQAQHQARLIIQNAQREAIGYASSSASIGDRLQAAKLPPEADDGSTITGVPEEPDKKDMPPDSSEETQERLEKLKQMLTELQNRGEPPDVEAAISTSDIPKAVNAAEPMLPPFDPAWETGSGSENGKLPPLPPMPAEPQSDALFDDIFSSPDFGAENEEADFGVPLPPLEYGVDDPLPSDWGIDDDDGFMETLAKIGINI